MARGRTPFQFDITAVNRTGPAWRGVENSIQRTQGAAQALQRTIGLLAGAAGVGLSIRAFTQMTSRALQAAEGLQDLSSRAGVTAEFLQVMRVAADQNGSSAAQFDDSISRLNRRLGLFVTTGASPAAQSFRQLGLDVRIASGELQTSEQVFFAAIEQMQEMTNVAETAAVASGLFGEDAGPRMVGLIQQGITGLEAYQDALRETGRVMDNDMVQSGAELNARMREIRDTFSDRMAIVILENADAIGQLAEALAGVAEWGVKAAAGFGRFLNLGAGMSGDDPQAAAARLDEVANMLTLRETGARRGDIRDEEALLRGAIGGPAGQATSTRLREAIRENGGPGGEAFQAVIREIRDLASALRIVGGAPASGTGGGTGGGGGGGGGGTPTRDSRALDPITDTIHVGAPGTPAMGVDAFQARIAQHFSDGDLLPAIDAIAETTEQTATRLDTLREGYDRFNLTMEDIALNGIAAVEDALVDLLMGAEGGFRDLARSVVAMLIRAAVQQTVSGALGSLAVAFGGGRASGGGVMPGRSYRVGESGPEMFTPNIPGEITPNGGGGGSGGTLRIRLEVDEGPQFSVRVAEITGPMVSDGMEVAVQTARAEIGADMANSQSRRLR